MPIVVVGGAPSVLGAVDGGSVVDEVVLSVAEVVAKDGGEVIEEEKPAAKGRKRARVGGRYRADDPSTPADEAWEG